MLKKINLAGSSYVGVFCRCSDSIAVVPTQTTGNWKDDISDALEVEAIETTLGGCMILGSLMCLNSRGAIIADIAVEEELAQLGEHVDVVRLDHPLNATGNNILANDSHALVHPDFSKKIVKFIEDHLGVEAEAGTIAGVKHVGSAAVATNKGILCHPYTTEEEKEALRDLFGLPVQIGTANYGTPLIGACLVANSNGAVVGDMTTGVELNRIEDALDLI